MARAIAVQKPETHDKPNVLSSHPAANHNVAEVLPQYTVTTQEAARLRREAMALDTALVKPLPWDVDARLAWMERIQGAAWHDRDALARVAIDDSDRITPALVHDFGVRLEWVRAEVAAARNTTAVTAEQAAALSTPALRARIEASHKKLHNALMYRFRDDDGQRTELRRAARGRSRAKVSARSVLLLDLAGREQIATWLRALPRGEGAALDALRVMHPEWVQRLKLDALPDGGVNDDMAARAYATLDTTLKQLLDAGRYLLQGDKAQDNRYPGYQRPASRKPRKNNG